MKKMLLTIFLVFFLIVNVNAADDTEKDWSLKTSLYRTIALDQEAIVQSGIGIQTSLYYKYFPFFLYLSKDENQVRFAGQSGPDVVFWSIGLGMKHKLDKHLTLSVDIGLYEPMFRKMGEPQTYPDSPFAEGLCRYLNKFLAPDNDYPAWDYYTLKYKTGIGGKVGLEFEYPITERFTFEMTAGYRYLKVQENVQGRHYLDHPGEIDWSKNYWTVRYDRDFSAFMIGGAFTFKF